MPEITSLTGFILAALVVLLIPGPGVIYILLRSLEQGLRAGLPSVLGLPLGALVHVFAASFGLCAILLASATAFSTIKLLGAAYLIYLGIRKISAPPVLALTEIENSHSLFRVFCDGIIVSVLNPKIAIFLLAFLPQFIDLGDSNISQQVFVLGLIYVGLALITDSAYALFAGRSKGFISSHFLQGRLPNYISGTVYAGLGLGTALAVPLNKS